MAVDMLCRCLILQWFCNWSRDVAMATNLGAKSAEMGNAPSFLGLAFHNRWQYGKVDGRIDSAEVLFASCKIWVNFGPLTLEISMII